MDERIANLYSAVESQGQRLDNHAARLKEIEIDQAVSATKGAQLNGRWATIGAVSLVLLGSIGSFFGNLVVRVVTAVGS